MNYFLALFGSTIGGFILLGPLVLLMHRTSKPILRTSEKIGSNSDIYRWSHFWIGTTERGIATTLFIWTPNQLPLFIGGWVAAKIAAGWGRYEGPEFARSSVIALVANAWSFGIALGFGFYFFPESLASLAGSK